MLTKLICDEETHDFSDNDEVYATVYAIAPNFAQPSASKFLIAGTNVYGDMDAGDLRVPNMLMWGPEANAPQPILSAKHSYFYITLRENDGEVPIVIYGQNRGVIQAKLNALPANASYESITKALYWGVNETRAYSDGGGDWLDMIELQWSDAELGSARAGQVVKKEINFIGSPYVKGKYRLRIQMGRAGVGPVAW